MVALIGVSIGVGIFSLTNYFLVQDWKNNIEFENERGTFFASAMEAHITRTFSTIDQQTESLAQAVQENKIPLSSTVVSEKANRFLENYVYTAAYIRSFSILDESGVVLASSNRENLHLKINLRQLGFPIDLGGAPLSIGNAILSRDLVDFVSLKESAVASAHFISAIPVIRRIEQPSGHSYFLVALLNPSYLSLDDQANFSRAHTYTILFDYAGRILFSTNQQRYPLGENKAPAQAIAALKKESEFGQYEETQLADAYATSTADSYLVNFRAARTIPIAVAVGISKDFLYKRWAVKASKVKWIGYTSALLFLGSILMLIYVLRGREQDRKNILSAHQAAKKASEAKSLFLANMSHEIRTPINSIVGMTDLVLETKLDVHQIEYLSIAKLSAQTLLGLIDNVLDFVSIEAGKIELEVDRFNLHRLCQQSIRTLALQAQKKSVKVILDIAMDVPEEVIGDQLRLGQILLNLLGNALKFTEKGEIRLSLAACQNITNQNKNIFFEIADTGIGITSEKQRDIFMVFNQGDPSVKRRYGGSGLGLSICQRLISMMGSQLFVQSQLNYGSQFYFSLALDEPEQVSVQPLSNFSSLTKNSYAFVLVEQNNLAMNYGGILESYNICVRLLLNIDDLEEKISSKIGDDKDHTPLLIIIIDAVVARQLLEKKWVEIKNKARLHWIFLQELGEAGTNQPFFKQLSHDDFQVLTKPTISSDLRVAIERINLSSFTSFSHDSLLVKKELQELSSEENQGHQQSYKNLHVLVVEDVLPNQILVQAILKKFSCTIEVAQDGFEALEKLYSSTRRIDLILMDVQMPGLDGLSATQEIRAYEKRTGCPAHYIVALTAHALEEDRVKSKVSGMDAYYVKPISFNNYRTILDEALKRRLKVMCDPKNKQFQYYDAIQSLQKIGDKDLLETALLSIEKDLEKTLPVLKQAIDEGDIKVVALLLHRLKGTLPLFCVQELSQQLIDAETLLLQSSAIDQESLLALYQNLFSFKQEVQSI